MSAFQFHPAAAVLIVLASATSAIARSNAQTPSEPVCVAVMLPSVQGVEGSATDVATAVRDLFVSYLAGPSIRSIPLESRLPTQAALEAAEKGCGYVLLPSVTKKERSGGMFGGAAGRAIGTAAWHIPYGATAGTAAGRAAAIAGAHTISNLASETRRKDEITLGYRMGTPESVASARPVSAKAKAKVDGEDLLTPLVERAAQDVLTAATAR